MQSDFLVHVYIVVFDFIHVVCPYGRKCNCKSQSCAYIHVLITTQCNYHQVHLGSPITSSMHKNVTNGKFSFCINDVTLQDVRSLYV